MKLSCGCEDKCFGHSSYPMTQANLQRSKLPHFVLNAPRDHKYAGVAPQCYGMRRYMRLEYIVIVADEPGAGIRGFTDEVTITIKDASPDAETVRDATQFFRQSLQEWYDGAKVWTRTEYTDAHLWDEF
jgi:hypothetical protein